MTNQQQVIIFFKVAISPSEKELLTVVVTLPDEKLKLLKPQEKTSQKKRKLGPNPLKRQKISESMASSSKKSIENQEDSESSYYVEEEEIDEAKVNNMVRIFVNTFKRNPDLWANFKNVVEESLSEVPITPISSTNSSGKGGKTRQIITDDKSGNNISSKKDKDFLMELKCLFLRSRNPSTSTLQQIIENIWPGYIINSPESTAYISKAHRYFDSFRNDLNKNMIILARQFIKDKDIEINDTLDKDEIINYVDEAIVKKTLSLFLKAIHSSSWNNTEFVKTLKRFVRHCLYFHVQHIINGEDKTRYSIDVLEKVKSDNVNNITKDLPVHSLSGLDLANNVFL
uniref:Uncharacterized protein n=1 Tax=Rhizophagus irregularis (strain DAOM 181602 / DAOM 197198 / MUCL 43194) TaxID=747089 RepID=U9SVE5_RHIID